PVGHAPEPQTDHTDVDTNRLRREAFVFERPIEAFHRFPETLADGVRLRAFGEVRDEKAEFVAAEPRVQVLPGTLLRDDVVGPGLLAQQLRHAFDDSVTHGVSERVVVPLESRNVDKPDRRPANPLPEREAR